jgi:hypothetical protein
MKGYFERYGQIVRTDYDSQQRQFVERVVDDVCPQRSSPDQHLQTAEVIYGLHSSSKPARSAGRKPWRKVG